MIEDEIAKAKNGEEAYIGIKINSLTDKRIIDKFIEASQAGVKIDLVVRGICCLVPGVEGATENIRVISRQEKCSVTAIISGYRRRIRL